MFIQPNFTFNGIYSRDLGVSIVTFDDGILNNMGIEYISDISMEQGLNEYHPYYAENISDISEIELNLGIYNPFTMKPMNITEIDMEVLYDWLITDNFAPFISDDDIDLIYYFKVVRIQKFLSFNGEGCLKVSLKPFSKFAYRRREYEFDITNEKTIDIFNLSNKLYYPMIEITNKGNKSTVNKINDMEIIEMNTNEILIIDNLSKLVQNTNNENRFNCCNRKWIKLEPKKENQLVLSGNMNIKIICEFPVVL